MTFHPSSQPPHDGTSPSYTHLELIRWQAPEPRTAGHDPRSAYVERFWLAVLGPSAVWFLRLASRELDAATDHRPAVLDLSETGRQLGLGHNGGRHSPLMRTIGRCITFNTARQAGPATLAIRTHLPPVPASLHNRLPADLREEIRLWVTAEATSPPTDTLRSLALQLLHLGTGLHETAERLATWGVGVEPARRAVAWAASRSLPTSDDFQQGADPEAGRALPELT